MKPGRELDALVAEKVMGLSYYPVWTNSYGQHVPHAVFDKGVKQNVVTCGYLKPYSTDIAAAWEVVEKFNGLYIGESESDPGRHWWQFVDSNEQDSYIGAEGKTAPHAICLAALKAVGHDIL